MKKELPKPSRSLKSFILDEDAKVMDRTATKVAITVSFIAINMLANADDANAKGHKNHSNHQNNVNAPNNFGTGIHAGNNPINDEIEGTEIPAKTIETWHSNHYNHTDASGGQNIYKSFLSIVAAPVTVWTYGMDILTGHDNLDDFLYDSGDFEHIDSGIPHHVPEVILKILEEQED